MKIKAIYIFPLTFFLLSCDPPRNIYFINQTEKQTKVKVNLKPDTHEFPSNFTAKDSIVLYLDPNKSKDLYFGIGTWSDEEVLSIVKCIKSLEIETPDTYIIYKSQSVIESLLKDNRKGFWWKTKIEIEIE